MQQLGLPVLLDAKMRLSNFIGAKNAQILTFVDVLFSEQNSSIIVLSGDKSSGKTHCLQGCTFAAMEAQLNAVYIDAEEEIPKGLIADLSTSDWVCIDNIEYLDDAQQQELFDLYNQIKHTQTKLIVSVNQLPDNFLKDLKTRLSLAVNYTLEILTDQQKITILQSKMKDKNINIDSKIYAYLFKYYSRDLSELLKAIDKLDKVSLQQKNSITIPLIKQVLLNAV
ncbi:DnaA regulatory inactivator Hda (Homologous to DnaA) [uncultured Candidatus Thioglobus sp.]|nr:DnaA regulatory inactivator Hda (Homologous to DnaA) [uncultured Candidatus Thioglobus sp.]